MNLLDKLMMAGQSTGVQNMGKMGVSAVPTDASQLKVPQMPLDPASVPAAAGANVAASAPATMANADATNWGGILGALAGGVGMAMGGKPDAPQASAEPFRGGARYRRPEGDISMADMAGRGGILNG